MFAVGELHEPTTTISLAAQSAMRKAWFLLSKSIVSKTSTACLGLAKRNVMQQPIIPCPCRCARLVDAKFLQSYRVVDDRYCLGN